VPKKVRELKHLLRRRGSTCTPGREPYDLGPSALAQPFTLSGKDGADAKGYQQKLVNEQSPRSEERHESPLQHGHSMSERDNASWSRSQLTGADRPQTHGDTYEEAARTVRRSWSSSSKPTKDHGRALPEPLVLKYEEVG